MCSIVYRVLTGEGRGIYDYGALVYETGVCCFTSTMEVRPRKWSYLFVS